MTRSVRMAGFMAVTAAVTAVFVTLVSPGCTANQDNAPISVSHSQGRPSLSVACSMDGTTAYVTDGRNVYRYQRNPAGPAGSWECILSQGERLEMALAHDPREPPPTPATPKKPAPQK